ncbi:transmembrane channel-like protein 3 [Gouania willdenowi]|uniref:transmembrane channel-like protein 3 n=1 Tax=Gouania willdenowi TaxID=441366 RepID=UPI0010550458|nr:transmembrane channel-like protein 3 [Gouania willdenowi]
MKDLETQIVELQTLVDSTANGGLLDSLNKADNSELAPEVTLLELHTATMSLQRGRAPGMDGLPADCIHPSLLSKIQEMLKLSIIDMIFTVASILLIDFIRGLVVRYLSDCCCWDLESKFPEYGEFKIAENVLHLIYNQGMIWMGAFFSPCLPAFNVLKLIGLMYLRSWAVLTCNVPHQQVFRASRSNNFYLAMLLFMLFLCMLPTIFAIVRYRPSQHCGPFSGQEKIYDIISETVSNDFPLWFSKVMSYITSPVVVLPAVLLLFMLIYYLQAIARSLKFTNNQLRMQLQTERTDDKKKVFQMAAARLQAPEAAAENPAEQQESDIASQGVSTHSPSPRHNGSITSCHQSPDGGNSIHTISQSASRAELSRGSAAGHVGGPSVGVPKQHLEAVPSRPPHPLLGDPRGSCRSRSYHHIAYNTPSHRAECIHSEPLYRKSIRPIHPLEAARIITAQSCGGRRGHATRYVIVNERDPREPRKKLLRSTTRIPRHYLMEQPPEILELYPRNIRRYTPRTPHPQAHAHRAHSSQQHLSEEEEGRRKAQRPHSLSDLQQPAHFYIGEHRARYGAQEEDWGGAQSQSTTGPPEPPVVRPRCHIRQSPSRSRSSETPLRPRARAKMEAPLTESDSASLASSSDQQNSSTDQYIQVIHHKERCLRADSKQPKMMKKKTKTNFDLNTIESNDLVCSNV